jgi:CBS domain-containing protein
MGQTVSEVARTMAELKVGAILVLKKGELRGIFSERDLMTRVVVAGRDPARAKVEEVMSTELTTIQESATVEDAMELMRKCNCRHLPTMRGTQAVGLVSMRDLMMFELDRKTEELQQMQKYIQSA